MHRRGIVILLMMFFLTACAGGAKTGDAPPDWVAGGSARYPADQYLMGRGADMQLDTAKDRARADLAKTFKVAVNEESSDVQTFQQQSAKGVMQQSGALQISRKVETRTDALVRGVEIADIWRDPAQQYHVLAVLPRAPAARGLRQEIQELDEATGRYIAAARERSDLLDKIAAASRAAAAQRERAEYQRMLRVIDITGQGLMPKWNARELEADLDTLLARMEIGVQASGGESAALDAVLRGAIADNGFHSAQSDAAFVLEAALTLEPLQRDGWYWYTGRLDLVLRDADGRVRGSQRWQIKESATVDQVAKQRAEDRAAEILKKDLRPTLLGFAQG